MSDAHRERCECRECLQAQLLAQAEALLREAAGGFGNSCLTPTADACQFGADDTCFRHRVRTFLASPAPPVVSEPPATPNEYDFDPRSARALAPALTGAVTNSGVPVPQPVCDCPPGVISSTCEIHGYGGYGYPNMHPWRES